MATANGKATKLTQIDLGQWCDQDAIDRLRGILESCFMNFRVLACPMGGGFNVIVESEHPSSRREIEGQLTWLLAIEAARYGRRADQEAALRATRERDVRAAREAAGRYAADLAGARRDLEAARADLGAVKSSQAWALGELEAQARELAALRAELAAVKAERDQLDRDATVLQDQRDRARQEVAYLKDRLGDVTAFACPWTL